MIIIDNLGKLLGFGANSEVFEYGKDKVCKLYKPQNNDDARSEYNLMLKINENELPAPKVYSMAEYNGRIGFIMDRVCGASLLDIMFNHIADYHNKGLPNKDIFYSDVMLGTIKHTAAALFDIHQRKSKYEETAKSYLSGRCKYNPFITDEEKEKILAVINNLTASDTICHGDTNPGNFIKQGENVMVIDWSNCVTGSYYLDIADYILTMKHSAILIASIFTDTPKCIIDFLRECGQEFVTVFCSQYNKLSEIDFIELNRWCVPVLAAKMGTNQTEEITAAYLNDLRERLHAV